MSRDGAASATSLLEAVRPAAPARRRSELRKADWVQAARVYQPAQVASVTIRTLGEFEVLRSGAAIASAEWQSRKSRDLLKLLIAKRGRPLHREAIIEILWPGAGAESASNRFSVALSRVRSALDPGRNLASDHFVVVRDDVVALDRSHVGVDVEEFLASARRGLSRHIDETRISALMSAYTLYRGDFLESDAYEEWALALREEARAAFIGVALALGDLASDQGNYEAAVAYHSNVLARDPYAEPAHLGLVRAALIAGRHGEARRHYETYVRRMVELEIEPAPFQRRATAGNKN